MAFHPLSKTSSFKMVDSPVSTKSIKLERFTIGHVLVVIDNKSQTLVMLDLKYGLHIAPDSKMGMTVLSSMKGTISVGEYCNKDCKYNDACDNPECKHHINWCNAGTITTIPRAGLYECPDRDECHDLECKYKHPSRLKRIGLQVCDSTMCVGATCKRLHIWKPRHIDYSLLKLS